MHDLISFARITCHALLFAGLAVFSSATLAGEAPAAAPAAATDMPNVVPGTSEAPESVFSKLDNGKKGYLSPEDVAVLPGFQELFKPADRDKDGKLSMKEFSKAWPAYTGK